MKKILSLLLVLSLCLAMCGCGKSEAVKNVETMIDALIGTAVYTAEELEVVHTAFAALSLPSAEHADLRKRFM